MHQYSTEHIERQGHGRDKTGLLPDSLGEIVEDIQKTCMNIHHQRVLLYFYIQNIYITKYHK